MEGQTPPTILPISDTIAQHPAPPPNNWYKIALLVIFVLMLMVSCTLAGIRIGRSQINVNQDQAVALEPTQAIQPTILPIQPTEQSTVQEITSGWDLVAQSGVQFYYPPYLGDLVDNKQLSVSVRTKREIIEEYAEQKKSGGCPSTCGRLTEDPTLLEKQFTLLSSLSNQPECVLSPGFKEDVKQNFILFTEGIGNKVDISSQKTSQGNCVLRIIEADGFDVALKNYLYKAGFMAGDKVIEMTASLFPAKGFAKVEALWSSFGCDCAPLGCDAYCYDKEAAYYQSFSLNDPIVKEVTSTYDQILTTLSLTQ